MATRLSVITTRTGDDGSTGLGNGQRIAKDSFRIAVLGDIDELNSYLGVLRTENLSPDIDALVYSIQNILFDIGAELSIPNHAILTANHINALEQALEHYNADLGKLQEFILPGGCRAASFAHLSRTLCRRAERSFVALGHAEPDTINANTLIYLNRLSDLLFVLARYLNHSSGHRDVLWQRS